MHLEKVIADVAPVRTFFYLTLPSITATFVHIVRPIRGRTVEPPDSIFDDGGFCVNRVNENEVDALRMISPGDKWEPILVPPLRDDCILQSFTL